MDTRHLMSRRQLGHAAAALGLATLGLPSLAQAAWPRGPVRVIYPYQGGGVGDAMFRLLEPGLQATFKQPFVIDIKPGAAGNIGAAEAARAAPDGQTLLLAPTGNYSVNQYLFKLGFDPLTQLEPVAALADAPLIAVVGPNVSATSLKQLSEQVRASGGRFNFGSPGAGSPTHLAGASFSLMNGGTIEHISFKGTGPMVQAMLAGDVQMAFPTLLAVQAQIKAGRLRPLAVLSKQRLPALPDVPTTAEAGYPDLVFGNWWVVSVPKGTDRAIVERLGSEIRQLVAEPATRTRLIESGNLPLGWGPAESAAFVHAEAAKYKSLIERTGIRLD
ncbi:tripartite tricarboxylate transporter substrate binding protein [Ramlibacter sp. AW1]|uniref:Tripartite tricarboxylate transporter substrate binding protein n=1 Tax=Ramlibacter aurantiacus TaxID=2801330 RepID=A0A936ZMX9_9BURK|nr:tripartite tricarboxylate transporter substrate binding protein [Ramlibacter aurantiacus]MBL0422702.1 tripartite tricarboxylate transporter substrate binding protein [Ramlibacter aurantiacus]